MEFLLLSCFESMLIKIADDREPGKSKSILKDRTSIESWPKKKNGLRKSQYTQVKVIASYHTQEEWTHWGDDAKFCRKYPGCRGCQTKVETRMLYCPTIQRSPMQTQGKAEGRDTPNRERSTFQLSCQMSEIPMEIYSIHSDNNSG